MEVTDDLKERVWAKAIVPSGYENTQLRKDVCGAWMQWDKYGDNTNTFGWHIDHICPKSRLEAKGIQEDKIDEDINLQPMNYRNNESKGDDYPEYHSVVTAKGLNNVEERHTHMVDFSKQEKLRKFYGIDSL